jgi:hypothetical protein
MTSAIVWFTGLPSCGKSRLARRVQIQLARPGAQSPAPAARLLELKLARKPAQILQLQRSPCVETALPRTMPHKCGA